MKKLLILFWLLPIVTYSQSITIDDTSNSPSQLVNLLLGNSCTNVSNVIISSSQSVATFNGNGSPFPINEGIIIRSGIAKHSEGSYTGDNLDSQVNNSGDAGLQNIVNSAGQSGTITDVAFLQFDFIPLSSHFSFDFLFASNEYGQWQCASFDTFAFFLTDLSTNTTTNLAVIPNTSTPVSVLNIRNQAYNFNCNSANSNLFSTYNVTNTGNSAINMRGFTTVMNASSTVTPNNSYRIRLVIGDYQDYRYDSAVFLASGSFITTIDLGPDDTICSGDSRNITSGLSDTEFNHSWTLDGNSLAETSNTLTVTQSGTYEVTITKPNSNCVITDQIVFSDLQVTNPYNLTACNNGSSNYNYDLTQNNETTLQIDNVIYDVIYYSSLTDATSHTNAISQNTNYNSVGNETIYIALYNSITDSFCNAIYSFDLLVSDPIVINPIANFENCDSPNGQGQNVNLLAQVLANNSQLASDYNFYFYTTENDAQIGGTGNNLNPTSHTIGSGASTQTVWVRIVLATHPDCFAVSNFDLIIHALPLVDTIDDVIECHNYTLPSITNGNYFSGPNGTGTAYNSGDIIDISGTYYIFNGPDTNGCTNQSSFQITLIDEYDIPLEHCGQFIVPNPIEGDFYTQTGGPSNLSNTIIPSGTIITTDQTIYYYAEVNGVFCKEEAFPLVIHPLPPVDSLNDVITCMSYTLEPLNNGNYFNAQGNPLFAGDSITSTQTITITNGPDVNGCSDSTSFTIYIINNVGNQIVCGSYILPNLDAGNYYTGPTGTGTIIPALTKITTSQTIYIYANTSTAPNCTDNMSFDVTILPVPPVDSPEDVIACNMYILPTLTDGNYYTEPNGSGTMLQAGNIIDLTGNNYPPGTYYVYTPANTAGCDNQSSFTISINPLPPVDTVGDLYYCSSYSLPTPIDGNYYTEPNASGTLVTPSMVFEETKTFYIYNIDSNTGCTQDIPFTVYYNYIGLPNFNNITACDSYTLENLTHTPPSPDNYFINYYSQSGGNPVDIIDPNNYTLTSTQTIYVFASNGDRFPCTEEKSFTITISETPDLNTYPIDFSALDMTEYCGEFTLPTLPATTYDINYYSQPGGDSSYLINPNNYTYSVTAGSVSETFEVWVYAKATNNTSCNDETHFQFSIYPRSVFSVDNGIICVNPETNNVEQTATLTVTQDNNLNNTNYNIEWYLNGVLMGNGFEYVANEVGFYDVVPIKLIPENAPICSYAPTTVEVTRSSTAIAEVILTDAFEDNAVATVNILNGFGIYEYQLDGGSFQQSNEFSHLSSGEHTITINDIYGNCGDRNITFTVIKYPKFFTPNGDGYNDKWNIYDLKDNPNTIISIFDRYGKLIKQISPNSIGWDGTYNGLPLPSTDYWFVVDYQHNNQNKTFRAHFTMKR
ncbi:T9SS type B sorting domain-containing protein [Flavobacterium sp. 9AF]|uniref:T9SS type B sorting domain-containing protein n=1 Tax=Flavobacterium sp. 9AF TaxID=2653142 RepID=UPI0013571462|nr:choice-of-anchor L domain-containing protein [Flavobacterium sp. 9AF]